MSVPAPGRPAPWMVATVQRVIRPLVRLLHRPTLDGLEHLPADRPFLLVANHSAGMGLAKIACLTSLYLERFGTTRPLAGFAHLVGFRVWPISPIVRGLGAVPSAYEAAFSALAEGVPLLVFPGGDHETLRPVWQAHRVDFGGRRGFLRVARDAGVPIVPLGIRGAHFTVPMLLRSRALATLLVLPRLFGLKRWGLSVLSVAGAAALAVAPLPWPARLALIWAWLTSPVVFWPIVPWTIRMRVGPPLEPQTLFAEDDPSLQRALDQVQAAVQRLVDR